MNSVPICEVEMLLVNPATLEAFQNSYEEEVMRRPA